MFEHDIVTVKYFRMTGDAPDPENDTLLGETEVRISAGQNHNIILDLDNGPYSVYAVGVDRFGNQSPVEFSNIVDFEVDVQ